MPTTIDGEKVSMLEAIQLLNVRAGAQGVGRLDMVEDRLVGIKSREVYEAPGAIALITAHRELENVTIERELGRYKRGVGQRWGSWSTTATGTPAQAGPGRLHRPGPAARERRDPDGAARRQGHGHRPEERRRPVRLQAGHLRRGDAFDQSQSRGFIEIFGMSASSPHDATPPCFDVARTCRRAATTRGDCRPASRAAGSPSARPRRCLH